MTKQEFLKRFQNEKLTIGAEYMMVLDQIKDEPLVVGCAYDQVGLENLSNKRARRSLCH